MLPIRAFLYFDQDILDEAQRQFRIYPTLIRKWMKKDIARAGHNFVNKNLRQAPERRPVNWKMSYRGGEATSERQREFVLINFLLKPAGKRLEVVPSAREDRMVRGWHLRFDYTEGLSSARIYHDYDEAIYIYGDRFGRHQQQFHAKTGWPLYQFYLFLLRELIKDKMIKEWPVVIEEMREMG